MAFIANMTLTTFLLLFYAATGLVSAAKHDCVVFPSKVSKLRTCSTKSAFCSSFLSTDGPTFTHTSTVFTTVSTGILTVEETASPTQTVYSTTVFVPADTVITETETAPATTVTTPAFTCTDNGPEKRAAPTKDCGVRTALYSKAITTACNCILRSLAATTITVSGTYSDTTTTTDATMSVTISTDTTSTTTSTTTTTVTPTETACATANGFQLQDQATNLYFELRSFGDDSYLHRDTDFAGSGPVATLQLEPGTGHLILNGTDQYASFDTTNPYGYQYVIFEPASDIAQYSNTYLTCSIGGSETNYELSCNAGNYSYFASCTNPFNPAYLSLDLEPNGSCTQETLLAVPVM